MKINELKTGNIIVNRAGYLGVILAEDETIIYQECGMDYLFEFEDDLTYAADANTDIMEVYERGSFIDYEEYDCLYQRDSKWRRPTEEQRRARERKIKRERLMKELREATERRAAERAMRADSISVIAQHFYGNRTGTEINRDKVDYFLHGIHGLYDPKDIANADRRIVHVPNSDGIVIVYDQTREDYYVNVEFPETYERLGTWYREGTGREMTIPVSCKIPEIGFEIHTCCFACRMDENGVLQSLQDDDYKQFIHYFPA